MYPLDTMEKLNREEEARHARRQAQFHPPSQFPAHPPAPSVEGWHALESCYPIRAFQDCLLVVDGIVRIGYRVEGTFYEATRHTPFEGTVTHWMALPEPPARPCAGKDDVPF